MKYAVAVLAFAASTVSAQSLSDIPQCAISCINDAITKATTCATTDYKCICANSDALTTQATPCVLSACGADVALQQVLPAVQAFCSAVNSGGGSTSETTSEATSTAASTSASTPASTPTSAPASTTAVVSTAESTVASTSEPTGYPTEVSTSSGVSVPVTSQSSYPGTTLLPTSFGGGNATSIPSATSAIPTAGAAVAGSIGGLAMMALGALAAF
ncbi:hypothetical protein F5Y03DRAFT_339688 [Xylaria venustula]|nr:hypothetical protein F5Y03DRAFT_339688 [Xylaria venustula]